MHTALLLLTRSLYRKRKGRDANETPNIEVYNGKYCLLPMFARFKTRLTCSIAIFGFSMLVI